MAIIKTRKHLKKRDEMIEKKMSMKMIRKKKTMKMIRKKKTMKGGVMKGKKTMRKMSGGSNGSQPKSRKGRGKKVKVNVNGVGKPNKGSWLRTFTVPNIFRKKKISTKQLSPEEEFKLSHTQSGSQASGSPLHSRKVSPIYVVEPAQRTRMPIPEGERIYPSQLTKAQLNYLTHYRNTREISEKWQRLQNAKGKSSKFLHEDPKYINIGNIYNNASGIKEGVSPEYLAEIEQKIQKATGGIKYNGDPNSKGVSIEQLRPKQEAARTAIIESLSDEARNAYFGMVSPRELYIKNYYYQEEEKAKKRNEYIQKNMSNMPNITDIEKANYIKELTRNFEQEYKKEKEQERQQNKNLDRQLKAEQAEIDKRQPTRPIYSKAEQQAIVTRTMNLFKARTKSEKEFEEEYHGAKTLEEQERALTKLQNLQLYGSSGNTTEGFAKTKKQLGKPPSPNTLYNSAARLNEVAYMNPKELKDAIISTKKKASNPVNQVTYASLVFPKSNFIRPESGYYTGYGSDSST